MIKKSLRTYKEKFHQIVWPVVFFVAIAYMIIETIKLNFTWISVGGGALMLTGSTESTLSTISSIFSTLFLLSALFGLLILFVKYILEAIGVRKLMGSDYNICTIFRDGVHWILLFLVLYIPIVLLSLIVLPGDVFIYTAPFSLPLLDGVILIAAQLILVMWMGVSSYEIAIDSDNRSLTQTIKMSLETLGGSFGELFPATVIGLFIAFPFYAIPTGMGWSPVIFVIMYLFIGLPLSILVMFTTLSGQEYKIEYNENGTPEIQPLEHTDETAEEDATTVEDDNTDKTK